MNYDVAYLACALSAACRWSDDASNHCVAMEVFDTMCPFGHKKGKRCQCVTKYDWYGLLTTRDLKEYKVEALLTSKVTFRMNAFSEEQVLKDAVKHLKNNTQMYMAGNTQYTAKLMEEK